MIINIEGRELPMPDFETITFEEASFLKRSTGLTLGYLPQAMEEGDMEAIRALALLALRRADGSVDGTALLTVPITAVTLVEEEPEPEMKEDKDSPNLEAVEEAADAEPKKKTTAKK